MGIFGRKKPDEQPEVDPTTAAENAPLPEGAVAESVDLSAESSAPMDEPPAETAGQINDKRMMYRRPEPLTPDRHAALGADASQRDFAHARHAHMAPITLREFTQVALQYPIVFSGDKKHPCAVMGLRAGVNLFVEEDGSPVEGAYMPAYFQQYPFLLARSKEADRSVLFIDRAAPMLVENGGTPLFENGEPSMLTKRAMNFLTGLQSHWRDTEKLIAKLTELDLFTTKELKLAQRNDAGEVGEARPVVKYLAVDFEKFKALPGEAYRDLAENDLLSPIYAHQISFYNWSKIVSKTFAKQNAARS